MVMSTAFVQAVKNRFPDAAVDLVVKKGIDFLLDYFPAHGQRYIFSKEEYKGLTGTRKFGKLIKAQKKYDIFFCLPDSFSSAVMGYAAGATERIGYKKEIRSIFLSHAFSKKNKIHRVEEYVDLLTQFQKLDTTIPAVELLVAVPEKKNSLIININSVAASRRLPKQKAISIIAHVRKKINQEIILIGSITEKPFVDEVFSALPDKTGIINLAGKTNLKEMVELFAGSNFMLTTDSGPAHVANALGVYTVVLFGAGNETNTAVYNKENRKIIRLGQLPCEPCVNNTCKLYGVPKCLTELDENIISEAISKAINSV